jgi:hypothetical protein
MDAQAYNCFKVMAEEHNLEKHWEKNGYPF